MAEGKLPQLREARGRRAATARCAPRSRRSPRSPGRPSPPGRDPAKHNIFDFLTRDPRTYLPLLSSTHIGDVEQFLKIGKYRIPLRKPELRLLRKSKPFWTILGEHDIWSTVLRVPITFPPEKFHGAQLSAMCTPDLLGTQGTFLLYTTRPAEAKLQGGRHPRRAARRNGGDRFETSIKGPENIFLEGNPPLEMPLSDRARPRRAAGPRDSWTAPRSRPCRRSSSPTGSPLTLPRRPGHQGQRRSAA